MNKVKATVNIVLEKQKLKLAPSTFATRKNYLLHEDRQNKIASDELKERIKYLEAENEYLKKSYSLILERNRQTKKK